jgi:glutathione reductase (NADPH)
MALGAEGDAALSRRDDPARLRRGCAAPSSAEELGKKGIDIRTRADVARIDKIGERLKVTLQDGKVLECGAIMYATGRRPKTSGMGLAELGAKLKASGAVEVDAHSQTSLPNIHAIGDCTDRVNLTPVAIREGHAYADSVFGGKAWHVDHRNIASAVFSHPPVGVVGLSEADAREDGRALDVYKADFKPLKHTISGRDERTLMKLVVDRKSQIVLGAHMVGMDAPEIIQAIAIAVKMGATKAQFDAAIAVHPTAAEEFVTMRTPVAG